MSPRRFAVLVMIGIALMQAAWIAVLPPFRGIDEVDHAYRAAAVAHGQWTAGRYAEDGRGRLVRVPADIAAAAAGQCWSLPYTGLDNCFPVSEASDGTVRIASSAANYNPPFYWVIGTVARPFSGAGALYAMRIATALICTLLIGAAAWSLGLKRAGPWRGIALMIALTPVALYSTTVAAPNGPEIAAAVALWCALLGLGRVEDPQTETRLLWVVGVAAVILGNLRELGPGFLVVVVAICAALDLSRFAEVIRRRRGAATAIGVLTLLSVLEQVAWIRSSGGTQLPQDGKPHWEWQNLLSWPLSTIAAFPFRDQPAPAFVYPVFIVVLVWFWVTCYRRSVGRMRYVFIVLSAGAVLMPGVLTAATYSTTGAIWQGRYGLPLDVGVPLLGALALERWRPQVSHLIVPTVCASFAAINLGSLLHVLAMESHRRVSRTDAAWHQPSVTLVCAVVLLGWAAWSASVWGWGDRERVGSSHDVSEQVDDDLAFTRARD
ncbi:DUF2142 domain-containing protein [Nocardioides terrisoli]|uniref:DUF2142 domain-containing protein n=1 Tax=Nocardioides terrisoli TaxID=3388267 RepID=UPI00287B707A|nr:DUF2142 domain-containing protein [Nocardioides marmorisolisilvae]